MCSIVFNHTDRYIDPKERANVPVPVKPLLFMECIDRVQGQFHDECNLTCGYARAQ